jgi:hypothetical protein
MTDRFKIRKKTPRVSVYPFDSYLDNTSDSTLSNDEKEMKWKKNSTFLLLRSNYDDAS